MANHRPTGGRLATPDHGTLAFKPTAIITLGLIVSVILLLLGCNSSEQYQRGYREGHQAGREQTAQERYDAGYRDGFERAKPGSAQGMPEWVQAIYRVMIWGGVLKIIVSLLYTAITLTFIDDNEKHVLGKVLFGALGVTLAIAVGVYVRLPEVAEAILLIPAPSSFAGQLFAMGVAACGMYWMLWLLTQLLRHGGQGHAVADGWIVCGLSALLAVLVPVGLESWRSVPDVTKYLAGALFSGTLLGGMYYFALKLLQAPSS
ncbi:MAG: Yae1 family protein [Gammaproteobacteria bacterium]